MLAALAPTPASSSGPPSSGPSGGQRPAFARVAGRARWRPSSDSGHRAGVGPPLPLEDRAPGP
eukprot:5556088-Lingulodinium_polyedra.AAC.1